jgi:hypothetical protein
MANSSYGQFFLWNVRIFPGMGSADGRPQLGIQLAGIQDHLAGFRVFHRRERNLEIAGIFDIDDQFVPAHLAHGAKSLAAVMQENVKTFADILVHDTLPARPCQ